MPSGGWSHLFPLVLRYHGTPQSWTFTPLWRYWLKAYLMGPIVLMGALLEMSLPCKHKCVVYVYPWHGFSQTHCEPLKAPSLHQVNHVEVFLVWDFLKCTDAKNPGRKEKGLFQRACYCAVTNQHRLWLEKRIRKPPPTHTHTHAHTQCSWCSSSKSPPAMTELGLKKKTDESLLPLAAEARVRLAQPFLSLWLMSYTFLYSIFPLYFLHVCPSRALFSCWHEMTWNDVSWRGLVLVFLLLFLRTVCSGIALNGETGWLWRGRVGWWAQLKNVLLSGR